MITTVCPVCKEECEHEILRDAADLVVQCRECGQVYRMPKPPEPRILSVRTIVSREKESVVCSVELFSGERVAIGDHVAAECGDDVIGVEITSIESGDKRLRWAEAEEITSLWTRVIEQVVVKASVHSGRMTIPLYQAAEGDQEFVVGETYTFGGRRIRISHIKLRDGPVMRKEGWKTVARKIKRIYAYLDERPRRW
jgi:uncharacterized Zn finger protein